MSSLCDMTATDLRHMIGRKDISPVELVEASIERIEMVDSILNAVVTKNYEAARRAAKTAEKNVLDGELLGLLHGLPIGIKDLEATRKSPLTSSHHQFEMVDHHLEYNYFLKMLIL